MHLSYLTRGMLGVWSAISLFLLSKLSKDLWAGPYQIVNENDKSDMEIVAVIESTIIIEVM